MTDHVELIRIEYTERAMQEDAHAAMHGDIMRGLVEMITNADDAYVRGGIPKGKIRVEVSRKRKGAQRYVRTRDRATGLSASEMRDRLARLGARTSGFESRLRVRGNRGRGFKDLVAFGTVTFESIKDGEYAKLTLRPGRMEAELERPRKASEDDRLALGIPRSNGSVVTVYVNENQKLPQHDRLLKYLSCNEHLRFILTDPNREIELVNVGAGKASPERVRYALPEAGLTPLADREVTIPEYPAPSVRLRVWRREAPAAPGDPVESHLFGILIQGSRTVYERTCLGLVHKPGMWWLYGLVDCPYIDELSKDFDDREEAGEVPLSNNPVPIIGRQRDGLEPGHPFTQALEAALKPLVEELVQAEEARVRRPADDVMGPQTRRDLARISRELSKLFDEEMKELEEETDLGSDGPGQHDITIIPPSAVLHLGEDKTLSVFVTERITNGATVLSLETNQDGIIDLLDGDSIPLAPHRSRDGVLAGQIRLHPLLEGEVLLGVRVAGYEETAYINVRAARGDNVPEAPQSLEFDKPHYRVGWTKQKSLLIRAPADVAEDLGSEVYVTSDNDGVVVRTARVRLMEVQEGWYEGETRIEGRTLSASARLTARLGDEAATTRVSVEQKHTGSIPGFTVEYSPDDAGIYRFRFSDAEPEREAGAVLSVYVNHPALRPIYGPQGEGEWLSGWRNVLAGLLTEAIVRKLLECKYRSGFEPLDTQYVNFDTDELLTRLLPRIQRVTGAIPSLEVSSDQAGRDRERIAVA